MPIRDEVFKEIKLQQKTAEGNVRRRYLKRLHQYTKRDTIVYASSALSPRKMLQVPGNVISITTEDIQGFMSALHGLKGDKLDLILHSSGGSLEAADQIVQYLRSKYAHIRAIIPQSAMSAATMIACACDEIVMGKHSALGPIDPQITMMTPGGPFTAPAQTILDEFQMARAEVIGDPRTAPLWVTKFQSYPPGFLKICENTINLSKDKVTEWLDNHMFINDPIKKGREIANWLGNSTEHKTHGRPIGIQMALDKGLKIIALEDDQDFQEKLLSVFHATMAAFEFTHCIKFVENHNGKGWFINVDIKPMIIPGQI